MSSPAASPRELPARCVSPGGRIDDHRLEESIAAELIASEWARHEATLHANCLHDPPSPPSWRREVRSYPDMGPSDSLFARENANRPPGAISWDPEQELRSCNEALTLDAFRIDPSEGDGNRPTGSPDVPAPIAELWRRSETRTPLLLPWSTPGVGTEAEAVGGIGVAGQARSATIEPLVVGPDTPAAAVLELVDRALEQGTWAVLIQRGPPDAALYRRLAMRLLTLAPDPVQFPRREMFRLWVVVEDRVDLDERKDPPFPAVFTHQALQVSTGAVSRHKVVRKLSADPILRSRQLQMRADRAARGDRDPDAESDPDTGPQNAVSDRKLTGAWFVRSREVAAAADAERQRKRIDTPSAIVFRRRHLSALTRVHA